MIPVNYVYNSSRNSYSFLADAVPSVQRQTNPPQFHFKTPFCVVSLWKDCKRICIKFYPAWYFLNNSIVWANSNIITPTAPRFLILTTPEIYFIKYLSCLRLSDRMPKINSEITDFVLNYCFAMRWLLILKSTTK